MGPKWTVSRSFRMRVQMVGLEVRALRELGILLGKVSDPQFS